MVEMKFKVLFLNSIGRVCSSHFSMRMSDLSGLVLLAFLFLFTAGCHKDDDSSGNNSYGTYSQSSGTVIMNSQTFYSANTDISAVKVTGGSFGLTTSLVTSSSNSSSVENSSFYGLNAVMLAYSESGAAEINSSGNKISSSGTGANGMFAYGKAKITTTGDKIDLTGAGSHAIMCSGGGIISVLNDTALTSGENSSTIATDKGGGTITVIGGIYASGGANSAAIYSTGTISCGNAALTANGAEALVIEGSNKITLNNCVVKSNFDKWGSLLYKSMSGDASGADGYLTITGGSFTYTGKKGGMFYNTNSTAHYTLTGVTLANSCDTLIRCIKGSWGASTASAGGITNFVADGQTMSGLIHVDSYSKVYLSLKNTSSFTGAINKSNTGNLVTLTMDYTSKWALTASSYINGLITNPGISGTSVWNITGNGFNVYYKSGSNPSLGGLTYSLANGGQLIPY
jgi:hypothetical protein